ncbi:phage late control D family protein [Mitsuokella sp.]
MFDILSSWLGGLSGREKLSRRAWVVVKYTPKDGGEAKDISEDLSKYFLSLSFTDNLSDTVDDITITLEDKAQLWLEEWFPEAGAKLDITIHTYNWINLVEGEHTLALGQYEIDEIENEGFPSTVQIKAVSALGNSGLRGVKKNRTWENISVWKCASDICKENNLKLFWDCDENPNLDHVEQASQSDLEFLEKICKDNGKNLKVMIDKIVIFDDDKYEQKDAIFFCLKPGAYGTASSENELLLNGITGYKLKAKTRDVYWKCQVHYQKTKDKTVIDGEFIAPDKTSGLVLTVNKQVDTQADAERLAKKSLREKNKEEFTGSFSLLGNFYIMSGLTIEMKGFGKFDGKYIITKAEHSVGAAYTTSIDVRKCLNGY